MLTMEHVTKRFGNREVIRDACVSFPTGVTGLIAPNGAGKSTLIKMLATLVFPSEGQILWNGDDIIALGEGYRALLGYLPQKFGYYPSYSPRAFLRYVGALQRMDARAITRKTDELLELVGLADAADRRMRGFSGGMIQRVGIATALFNDPRLLILDEPTAGLDPSERVRFRNIIHGLARDRTVILSTHIVSDVESIAGQIVLIKDGAVTSYASARELTQPLAGRVFELPGDAPLPPQAVLLGERERDGAPVVRVAIEMPLEGAVPVNATLEDAFLMRYRPGR